MGLLPLHLTPLERFFCDDDRPSHPMSFIVVLDFTGVVDRLAFEAAVVEALERHPILNAYVRPAKRGRLCWVRAKGSGPTVDWGGLADPISIPGGEQIDITVECGLRVWVRHGPEKAVATFQFHHACTDGIGAYRFLGDLMAYYGLRVPNEFEPPRLERLNPERMRDRLNLQIDIWRTKNYWAMIKRGLRLYYEMLRRRPAPLNAAERGAKPPRIFPGIQSISFSRDEFEAIRSAALEVGTMWNDLLLAALFRTLHEWTQSVGDRSARRPLRILMPTDLRDGDSLMLPAACLTSNSFLTREQADCRDPAKLLHEVSLETTDIKNQRRGVQFSDAIAIGYAFRMLWTIIKMPTCLASAALSNIGDPTRRFAAKLPRRDGRIVAGNLLLDDITGVPPLRPRSNATFSVFTYRRKLTISIRCSESHFSDQDTMRLLELYARHLRSYASAPVPVATA